MNPSKASIKRTIKKHRIISGGSGKRQMDEIVRVIQLAMSNMDRPNPNDFTDPADFIMAAEINEYWKGFATALFWVTGLTVEDGMEAAEGKSLT